MPVVDASTYVALINRSDAAHEASKAWFLEAVRAGLPMRAPGILLPEVAAAICRGLDDPELAREAVDALRSGSPIALEPVSPALLEQAASIALQHRVRGCDALYVAVAAAHDDVLVTLDRQQRERGAEVVRTARP